MNLPTSLTFSRRELLLLLAAAIIGFGGHLAYGVYLDWSFVRGARLAVEQQMVQAGQAAIQAQQKNAPAPTPAPPPEPPK